MDPKSLTEGKKKTKVIKTLGTPESYPRNEVKRIIEKFPSFSLVLTKDKNLKSEYSFSLGKKIIDISTVLSSLILIRFYPAPNVRSY